MWKSSGSRMIQKLIKYRISKGVLNMNPVVVVVVVVAVIAVIAIAAFIIKKRKK